MNISVETCCWIAFANAIKSLRKAGRGGLAMPRRAPSAEACKCCQVLSCAVMCCHVLSCAVMAAACGVPCCRYSGEVSFSQCLRLLRLTRMQTDRHACDPEGGS